LLRPPLPPAAAPVDEVPERPAPESAGREPIPWLAALPAEFRERIPSFRINVFAYSRLPDERFAIIDMHRYEAGERIPGDALLLEIRADCLVLELDGVKFRYPRP
jgi:general secretion pathway protein B